MFFNDCVWNASPEMRLSIGNLLRFSSSKDGALDKVRDNRDSKADLMPEPPVKKPASVTDCPPGRKTADADFNHIGLEDLCVITRNILMDDNLEVSRIRPFFWTMVEIYVDRFQVFPFDAIKALFSYLELHAYPEAQLRELTKQLEQLYEKQHGGPMREPAKLPARHELLEDEINELRETLKYAAIVGERIENDE